MDLPGTLNGLGDGHEQEKKLLFVWLLVGWQSVSYSTTFWACTFMRWQGRRAEPRGFCGRCEIGGGAPIVLTQFAGPAGARDAL